MKRPRYTPVEALQAIAARIQGVFDDRQLMRLGPLSTDARADVLTIINLTTKPGECLS